MADEMDMTSAIRAFLTPIYEKFGDEYATLEDFVDNGFFQQGGEIQLKLPKWMEEAMGIEQEPMAQIEFEGIDV